MTIQLEPADDVIECVERLCNEARFEEAEALLNLRLRDETDPGTRLRLQLALVHAYNEEDWTRGLRNHDLKHALLDEIDATVGNDGSAHAHALYERGMALHVDMVMGEGDAERELACFTGAVAAFEALDDQEGAALAMAFVGIFHHVDRLDRDTAEPILRRAYEMATRDGGSEALAEAARHLGQIRQERGDPQGALPLLEESYRARAEGGHSRNLASALHAIGFARFEAGDLDGADDALKRARYYGERYGNRVMLAMMARTEADLAFTRLSGAMMRGRTHP